MGRFQIYLRFLQVPDRNYVNNTLFASSLSTILNEKAHVNLIVITCIKVKKEVMFALLGEVVVGC